MSSDAITSNSNTLLPLPVPPLKIGDRLRILVERGWHEGCGFPSPSELDYAIALEMLRGGHTDAEVVWVFKAPLFGFSRGKHHRDDYIQRTLRAAHEALPSVTARPPLSSFTLEDAAAADWTLPDPLVGNLIFPESITLLAGPPKVGKTFFVMQMLAALASGTPFMDEFVVPAPLRCLHLTAETPAAYYWDRWRNQFDARFAAARGRIRFSTEKGLNVVDDFEAIGDLIRSHAPHLVVFDTWIRYHNADENDAAEMKQAMTQIDKFIKAFSVAVLLVHHTKKASFEEVDDAMSLIRGTGVLRSHPNTNLVMLPSKEEYAQGVVKHVRFSMESNFVPPLDAIMLERNDEGLFEKTQRTTAGFIPVVLTILRAHKDHALPMNTLGIKAQVQSGVGKAQIMRALRENPPPEVRIDVKEDGNEWVTYIGGELNGTAE